jgi:hypothetical protein
VSSIFGELYSDDAGQSFKPSTGGGTSQSVRYVGVNGDGGLKFGVTGQYGAVNGERLMLDGCSLPIVTVFALVGVGWSVDGGQTFKTFNTGLEFQARYGAFPTDTTWYVAAGTCIAVYMPRCLRVDCME